MSDPSILGRLREKRTNLGAERKPLDLEVPGYDGELVVRYAWRPYEQMASKGRKLEKVKNPARRDLLAAADTLAEACDEVLVRTPDGLDSLGEDGAAVRFEPDLATGLGFTAKTARETVFGVFQNEYAVIAQAVEVSEWLQAEAQEVDSALSGS